MSLRLWSPAFSQGEDIPKRLTADGENRSPAFKWSGAPEGTKRFLLLCDDPDAPGAVFHHWTAYNIPDLTGLPEGYGPESLADGFQQAINDFGQPGCRGPAPPKGDPAYHDHFRPSALSEAMLPVAPSANCLEVIVTARPYVLECVE